MISPIKKTISGVGLEANRIVFLKNQCNHSQIGEIVPEIGAIIKK